MGAEPYFYRIDYQPDLQKALDALRDQVFRSGQYRGAETKPSSPEEALELTGEEGTASILDIFQISEEPEFCCAAPFSEEELQDAFGTTQPAPGDVDFYDESYDELWESLERGMARYVIAYEDSVPVKIFFVGYSFD